MRLSSKNENYDYALSKSKDDNADEVNFDELMADFRNKAIKLSSALFSAAVLVAVLFYMAYSSAMHKRDP